MPMMRTIKCDICGDEYTEAEHGAGFPGWSILQGISPSEPKENEVPNMTTHACPLHTAMITETVSILQERHNGVDNS